MPWSKKQVKVAEAVKHGWHPKGTAQGFTQSFASQVISEGQRKKMKKHLKVESSK
jgi:hypothetical protein